MSWQQGRQGSSPIPLGRGLSPIQKNFLESSIMSVLCDIHQQVVQQALGHITTVLGFCMGLCSFFQKKKSFGKVVNLCWKTAFYT
jgi:hypothetical protein